MLAFSAVFLQVLKSSINSLEKLLSGSLTDLGCKLYRTIGFKMPDCSRCCLRFFFILLCEQKIWLSPKLRTKDTSAFLHYYRWFQHIPLATGQHQHFLLVLNSAAYTVFLLPFFPCINSSYQRSNNKSLVDPDIADTYS